MIITEVLGNIQNGHPEKEMKEWLEVEWEELNKRRMRRTTDQGREIAIKLEDAQHLHVGDVLYEDHDVQIVLRTKMEPVFVVYPKSMQEMGKASFELGNRAQNVRDQQLLHQSLKHIRPLTRHTHIQRLIQKRFQSPHVRTKMNLDLQ